MLLLNLLWHYNLGARNSRGIVEVYKVANIKIGMVSRAFGIQYDHEIFRINVRARESGSLPSGLFSGAGLILWSHV